MDSNNTRLLHAKNLVSRMQDLNEQSNRENRFTFSEFQSIEDNGIIKNMGLGDRVSSYGGYEYASRVLYRFGRPEELGYDEAFPIKILHIVPDSKKFGELEHRDVLGTIMGLGIDRDRVGDIRIYDNEAYVFALDSISDYIMDNVTQIRRMSVNVTEVESLPSEVADNTFQEITLIIPSMRIDGLVSAITGKSRSVSEGLILEKKVLLNGETVGKKTAAIKIDDVVVIRGYGKYIFKGATGETNSGKLHVTVLKYV